MEPVGFVEGITIYFRLHANSLVLLQSWLEELLFLVIGHSRLIIRVVERLFHELEVGVGRVARRIPHPHKLLGFHHLAKVIARLLT